MVMQVLRSVSSGGLFKYFVFGLIGLAIGGLALMDVRGVLQGAGSISGNDIAYIGNKTLDIRSFNRTVQRSLAQYRLSPEQAYKLGLVDEILSGQISTYLLSQEAERHGIELDKQSITEHVAQMVQPSVLPGQTIQQTLEQLLQRQGMNEDEFIHILKRETTDEMFMQAVRSGFQPNKDILAQELIKFQNQTRDVDAIFFADKDIENVTPASEEQLEKLYESLKHIHYKIPEYRSIKIAVFNPDELSIDVSVTPEEISQTYQDHQNSFTLGEQVILTQALVDDAQKAQNIYEQTQSGKSLKDAVIAVIGNDDAYYEGRDFEVSAMLPAMAEATDSLDEDAIAAPIQTMLGYHVLRLDARVPAKVRPFKDVADEISTQLLQEKREEQIYKISQDLDKDLDSGIPFETLAEKRSYPLSITTLEPFDEKGLDKAEQDGLQNIERDDKDSVRSLAYELTQGEASLLQELPSGKIAAFMLTNIEPQSFTPFKALEKELADQYIADQSHAENHKKIATFLAEIGTGGSEFKMLAKEHNKGIMTYKEIGLSTEMPAPLTNDTRAKIFQASIDGYEMLELPDQYALIRISGYDVPEITQDEEMQKALQSIAETLDKEMADDGFLTYMRALAARIKPRINEALLKQVFDKKEEE